MLARMNELLSHKEEAEIEGGVFYLTQRTRRTLRTRSFLERTYGMSADLAGSSGMITTIFLDMINKMDMMDMILSHTEGAENTEFYF